MNTTVLRLACFALLLHALAPNPVSAAENMQFRVYVGSFNTNAWVAGVEEKDTLELGFELQGAPIAETQFAPLIGTTANVDNAAWFYLGLRWNRRLDGGWQMAPSFAVTLYDEGDSKELGHELAFRSGIEFARRFTGGHALGAQFYHISNAGIADLNPGNNSLVLFYSVPLSM